MMIPKLENKKHAVHSPIGGHLALTQVSQTTALPEQETTPTETIPLDATAVAAELAEAGAPAAPVGLRIQLQLVDFRPLAVPLRRSADTSRERKNAANLHCT